MDFARVYELHKFFSARRYPIPRETIQAEFGYGRTTFHHLVTYMQDYLDAPIQNSRGQGYYYALREGEVFELPGLWLNAQEMMALALLEQVSADIQPELVKNVLSPIRDKLESLLSKHKINKTDWQNRLKVITQWQRDCEPRYFMNILQALLSRKQLRIIYWKWKTAETSERVISPQRIVYY
jgi:predicted DNA-binding transcriptional regulator YafY